MAANRANWWMPLYIGDYLRDTTRLTRDQHGAYFLLMMDYWVNGPPPDDDSQLATITKASPIEWRRLRSALLPFFSIVDGVWRQKRLDQEIEKAQGLNAQRQAAGQASARSRRNSGSIHFLPRKRRDERSND